MDERGKMGKSLNYTDAVSYILGIPKFTKKNALENTRELLKELGDIQKNFKIIHVAGTNGKGSVCTFISSLLEETGKKTGLFTSPHLEQINERFRVHLQPVSDELFLYAFHKIKQAVARMEQKGFAHPTFFEYLFGMAMVIFAEEKTEYVILETGLGGRLDATNVIEHPAAAVITSVGLDHMEYLGDTLEKIAAEKAGIIKTGVPLIFDAEKAGVNEVIKKKAEEKGIKIYPVGREAYQFHKIENKYIDFSLKVEYDSSIRIILPIPAKYQMQNAAVALKTVCVADKAQEITESVIRAAFLKAQWPGRMESVLPGIYVDGAHNEDGILALIQTVKEMKQKKFLLLFSAVKEKEHEKMIREVCAGIPFEEMVVTQMENDRAVPVLQLETEVKRYTKRPVAAIASLEEAFFYCRRRQKDAVLLCFGSLYLAGAVKEIIRRNQNDRF